MALAKGLVVNEDVIPMLKGFNSDLQINGHHYHVQTEDWGSGNPYLVSKVFHNGAVVKSVRTSYAEVLPTGPIDKIRALGIALEEQHKQVVSLLEAGHLL